MYACPMSHRWHQILVNYDPAVLFVAVWNELMILWISSWRTLSVIAMFRIATGVFRLCISIQSSSLWQLCHLHTSRRYFFYLFWDKNVFNTIFYTCRDEMVSEYLFWSCGLILSEALMIRCLFVGPIALCRSWKIWSKVINFDKWFLLAFSH